MQAVWREYSPSIILSVLLHGLVAAGLLLMTQITFHSKNEKWQQLPLDAVVVDARVIHAAEDARAQAQRQAAAVEKPPEPSHAVEIKPPTEPAAAPQKDTQLQRAAAAQRAAHAQQAAQAQLAAQAERAAQAAQAQRAAEAQKAAEAHKAAEAQRAAEAQKAAEAQRAADAKRAAELREKADNEAELRRQLADEEHVRAVESGPLAASYYASLQARMTRAWIKPPSAGPGIDCRVEVTQVPGGEVVGARVTQCNGDAAVRQSIENAVYRASPLPDPPDPALFHRVFVFEFKPNE